jgi:hypothetical protein
VAGKLHYTRELVKIIAGFSFASHGDRDGIGRFPPRAVSGIVQP